VKGRPDECGGRMPDLIRPTDPLASSSEEGDARTDTAATPMRLHRLLNRAPVFALLDRLQVGAISSDNRSASRGAVFARATGPAQVQGGLAAHGGQQGIGALQFDHLPHPRRG